MTKILDIKSYTPTRSDKFFFDNNIWIYLFYPLGNHKKEIIKHYERFFQEIFKAQSKIFISSLVLSEFFNTCVKTEFNVLARKSPEKYQNFKKDFRNKDEYCVLMKDLKKIVGKNILSISERIDDGFEAIDIDNLFDNLENNDFNDKYFIALAEKNDLQVVTNDSDFFTADQSIKVITANPKLLELNSSVN